MYQLEEISIEITNSCPLACIHCSSGSAPERLPDELLLDEHIDLLVQAKELGAKVFSISGGSPLNYSPIDGGTRALVDLVDHAVKIGYERILMYTTGHSQDGPLINVFSHYEDLLGYDQMTWIFSLHSDDFLINGIIMGRDWALAEITQSITQLIKDGETVEVHMVPMKPNYGDIPGVRALCEELGVSKMSCLRFVPQTRGKDNEDELGMTVTEFAEMQFILHNEMKLNDIHPVELRLGCPIDFRHSIGMLSEKCKPCHAGDDLILVRPTGDVHPCAAWKSLPADANVRTSTLEEIWHQSKVFKTIRAFKYGDPITTIGTIKHKAPGYRALGGSCGTCSMLESCMTGCPAQRLHAQNANEIWMLYSPTSDPLCHKGGLFGA